MDECSYRHHCTFLKIHTWVGTYAAGACHFYGRLQKHGCEDFDVYRILDVELAAKLTVTDQQDDKNAPPYEEGESSTRFNNEDAVIAAALGLWEKSAPNKLLLLSKKNILDPSKILNKKLTRGMKAANKLFEKWHFAESEEEARWLEKDWRKQMNKICQEKTNG